MNKKRKWRNWGNNDSFGNLKILIGPTREKSRDKGLVVDEEEQIKLEHLRKFLSHYLNWRLYSRMKSDKKDLIVRLFSSCH